MDNPHSKSCWLYVLESDVAERYYVGVSGDPTRRLEFHNMKERGFTARYRPWRIVFTKEFGTREEALQAEKKVKSWKSREMIRRLICGEISL